jgi:hypothetical protein
MRCRPTAGARVQPAAVSPPAGGSSRCFSVVVYNEKSGFLVVQRSIQAYGRDVAQR